MGEPTNTGGSSRSEQIAAALATANMLAGGLPLLIQGVSLSVRMIAALFRHQGIDIGPFQAEIARFDSSLTGLQGAIDEFHQIVADMNPGGVPPTSDTGGAPQTDDTGAGPMPG